jgi:hypothetical protein
VSDARDKKIVELRSRGLTLQGIAEQFGLTKERVRQITQLHQIARRFATVPELMARFGATEHEVTRAIQAAGLHKPRRRRSRNIIIADAELDGVVRHLTARIARDCIICGKSFEVRGRSRKRLCSPECFHEHRRRLRRFTAGQVRPMSEPMRRIHELLSAEPPGTTWISFTEAMRLSGLTKMQLTWLRWRGIIAVVPSGKRSRYSARHCELLRRFLVGQKLPD